MRLQEKMASLIPPYKEKIKNLIKEYGDTKVGDINISQIYGGMRDVKALVTDISYVDPNEGIRIRGYSIPELLEKLPRQSGQEIPIAGGAYYLLLTGELPTLNEALEVEEEWKARQEVPQYVIDLIRAMPAKASPMTMFSMAILAMQADSKFTSQMEAGLKRDDFWIPTLEDSLDLTAKLPVIAAFIYRDKYVDGKFLTPRAGLDWSANFGYMIGVDHPQYYDLCRLYFIIHSDHESGNVSAHTMHLIGSALSDVYYAGSAAMNGLAGPLHGRANQEALRWLITVFNQFGKVPTKDDLRQYAWDTLKSGMVIPGYGHAVLRKTDPRFAVQMEFGKKYFPDDEIFKLACLVYETVPDVLRSQGKVKDPWPNVDAISGALQYHYGLADCAAEGGCGFYTVMFGISRMLGITANMVWARAISQPIERPKSLTTAMIEELVKK